MIDLTPDDEHAGRDLAVGRLVDDLGSALDDLRWHAAAVQPAAEARAPLAETLDLLSDRLLALWQDLDDLRPGGSAAMPASAPGRPSAAR